MAVDEHPLERHAIRIGNGVLMRGELGALEDVDLTVLLGRTKTSGLLDPILDLDTGKHPRSPRVSRDPHEVQHRPEARRALLGLDIETGAEEKDGRSEQAERPHDPLPAFRMLYTFDRVRMSRRFPTMAGEGIVKLTKI